jgi:hypothetical protein
MERVKGGVTDDQPQGGIPPEAANDPSIDGSGPAGGWDPFEVWRTRVRDVQQQRSRGKTPIDED